MFGKGNDMGTDDPAFHVDKNDSEDCSSFGDVVPASIGAGKTLLEAKGKASVGDGESVLKVDGVAASIGDGETHFELGSHDPGVVDGRLELLEKLGEGGMGIVWKARDRRLGRFVAIKRPKGAMLDTEKGRARFLREARSCAGLAHPNIITIYSVGEDREGPFIEMEFVDGLSLGDEVRQHGPFDEARARPIALALCDALALAHSRGIIHRDIKPSNILLTARGIPKLGDFGLAAAGEDEDRSSLTATGAMLGTLYYASPEQLHDAKVVNERSDAYSLGATLYFLLTGESPHRLRLERLPAGLRSVIEKAMEEDPAERYPDMKTFERAISDARIGAVDGSCPQCRKDNPLTALHCTHCGFNLKDLFQPCLKCEMENRIDQKFCQSCGANLEMLAAIARLKAAIEQAKAAHNDEEVAQLAERGLAMAPDDIMFDGARRQANENLKTLQALNNELRVTGQNQVERRIEILECLLTLTPGNATVHEDLAAARIKKQRQEDERQRVALIRSVEEIQRQLSQLPEDDFNQRAILLEQLLELQPGDPEIKSKIQRVRSKRIKREIVELQQQAKGLYEKQRFEEALANMELACTLAPQSEVLKRAVEVIKETKANYEQQRETERKNKQLQELEDQIQQLRQERAYFRLQQILQEAIQLGVHPPEEEQFLAECQSALEQAKTSRIAAIKAVEKKQFHRALELYDQGYSICTDDQFLNNGKLNALEDLTLYRKRKRRFAIGVGSGFIILLISIFCWWSSIQADDDDWSRARRVATMESYQLYLLAHPEGQYARAALENISDFKAKAEEAAKAKAEQAAKAEASAKAQAEETAKAKAEQAAKAAKAAEAAMPESAKQNYTEDLGGGVNLEMVWVPGGTFQMGSNDGESDEKPVHQVTLTGFWIGKCEVTQEQYEKVTGSNPSNFKGPRNPVEQVSWDKATAFCRKLAEQTGKRYALPSEAQWEYACRAGSQGKYGFGDSESELGKYAWFDDNSNHSTHPVGQKQPNRYGLYDMHGNVYEWCQDCYSSSYPAGAATHPTGPVNGIARVLRGGSWYNPSQYCRSAYRNNYNPDGWGLSFGFRLARTF